MNRNLSRPLVSLFESSQAIAAAALTAVNIAEAVAYRRAAANAARRAGRLGYDRLRVAARVQAAS